jgi:type I restriction enzyme S subunit
MDKMKIDYVPFGTLLKSVVDNRGKTCPTSESGIPLIATNCISNNYLYPLHLKVRHVNEDTFNNWFRGHPEPGDMIFVTKGSPGRVAWVPKPVGFCIAQDMVAIRADDKNIYPKYLFASLRSNIIQKEIEGLHVGTLIPHFKKGDFDDLYIPIPERKLQKFIGDLYFNISLKIDLLHRQNKTLESMAETLFRQWFVEEAQEDWEENSLLEVIQLVGGGTPKTSIAEYWGGDIPWLAGGDIASNHKSFISYSAKSITKVGLNNSSAKLLPKYATVISARGTVGKYCLLAQPMAFSQSNYGILPNMSECFFFTYLLINHVVEELQSSAYGSVFDTITTTTFKEIKVTFPIETEIFQFEESVSPYFKKMFLNKSQINTLEKLRDTLLPKLMSGEVRVNV